MNRRIFSTSFTTSRTFTECSTGNPAGLQTVAPMVARRWAIDFSSLDEIVKLARLIAGMIECASQ